MISLGLDCGSSWCKGVVWDSLAPMPLKTVCLPTGWDLPAAVAKVLAVLREDLGPAPMASTGYGRALAEGAVLRPTEISCHARGASMLRPGAATVVDVGGQDTKAIAVGDGRALSFQMNDRCAAGTGRFLTMTLDRLGMTLDELDHLETREAAPIKSVCAVFAESEMMGLLASGAPRSAIALGVLNSLADKAAALAARLGPGPPVVMTGGLSACRPLAGALSLALGLEVETLGLGRFAGALGAAAMAAEKAGGREA
ncbi:MAG: acyl-CoA dehydratase activase [Deltaproteobacteria bacterium]|nr:acyl-CoA dehydratase activase [Deltaproteobacteria bacterium]